MALVQRVEILVRGRVQGVAFRWYTLRQARELGLTGSVRNLPDGSVRIVAEGPPDQLEALLAWVALGPPHAQVTTTEVNWGEARHDHDDFLITG
jgi:acylphosphatase